MTAFCSRGFAGAGTMAAGFLLLSVPSQVTAEEQPAMRGAIEHLRKAEAALQRASSNKGGYRGNALELVHKALVGTPKGIRYDSKN
ncbi:MAG: hypothetical protein QF742_12765 [Alphaproteobacteria bacterium]|nr:hypothetical protein [Alphaproteobacteria bacterium]